MAELNPEVFEDLQVAEKSRPLFEAAGRPLRTWEAYCLAFNERNLLRRELLRIREGRGSPTLHPEVFERLQAIRTEFDPLVVGLREFLNPEPASSDEHERQEMVLGFIAVSPTAREIAAKWIGDPGRFRSEATQKLQLIENVVEKYRRALRAEIEAQMVAPAPPPLPDEIEETATFQLPPALTGAPPQPGPVTQVLRRPSSGLPPPESLEGTEMNGEISLIWSAVPGASGYVLLRATGPDAPFAVIARPAQDCYADAALQNGQTYRYVVVAVDATGAEGIPSREIRCTPLAPPVPPARLSVVAANASVTLSWTASPGAAKYRVLRATSPAGPFVTVATSVDVSFTDTSVVNGTGYFYFVIASNPAGESAASSQIQAMPVAPPPAPVGLVATPGNARVTLAWTPVHGASSYAVQRATDPAGPFTTVAGPSGSACADTGVINGTTYVYAVRALNAGGSSAPSALVTATPIGAPAVPAGLSATPANGEVQLAWPAVPGATGYVVRRAAAPSGPWSAVAHPTGPAYTDTSLPNGSAFFYTVAARNAGGESLPGEAVPAIPLAPPAAPTGLQTSPGNGKVTLSWVVSGGADGYIVKRATSPSGPYETLATIATSSYADTTLANNTTYYYSVIARNAGGESPPSAEAAASPVGPPTSPSDLEAAPGDGRVTLRWLPVPGSQRYRVMRSTTPGGPYTAIANPVETTWRDSGLTNGTTYYYVVRATNDGGKGPYSSEARAVPVSAPGVPPAPVATPGNASVSLTWPEIPGSSSYVLKRALSADGPYTSVATPSAPCAVDADVTNGTAYYYVVCAVNAGGESPRSAPAVVVPLAPPTPPAGLAATPGRGLVTLTWSLSPRAVGYAIRRATSPDGPFELVGNVTATAFTDPGVTNGTTYHYQVSARNSAGESAASAPVAVQPVAPPTPPTGLQVSPGNSRVALSWAASPRATSYVVKRATSPEGPFVAIASPAGCAHLDVDLANGRTIYYVVVAINAGGESSDSDAAPATPVAPPAPVVGIHASAGNSSITLSWPAVPNASGYAVRRSSAAADGPFATIATVVACEHTDAELTNGSDYYYRIMAINGGGESPESQTVTAAPIAAPAAPTGLSGTPGHHEVTLTWAPSNRATGYMVKRAARSGGPYAELGTTPAPPYQDAGLENGRIYYYVVSALNDGGESVSSAETQATPMDPPETPTNFVAVPLTGQVALSWNPVLGASYYRVKRATDKRGPYATVANVSRTTWTDDDVRNNKTYFYVVRALNAGGRSAHSARIAATPVPEPQAPARVMAVAGNFRVTLSWELVPAATAYSIKRSTRPGGPYTTIARVGQGTYVDASVANGTTYYYVIRAAVGQVKGPTSAQVQATPSAPPLAPGGLAATPGHGLITLSWTPVGGAILYHVKRSLSADGRFDTIGDPDAAGFEDVGLENGTKYFYRVSAENSGGEGPDSPAIGSSPVAPPAVPTSLHAVPANGEITLSWPPVEGAVRYHVKRAMSVDQPFATVGRPAEPAYTDTGLANGTCYHYVVSAVNPHGESLDSFPAEATPVGPPGRPAGLVAMSGNSRIDLSWTPVPLATRYRVMRGTAPGGPYTLVSSPHEASYSDGPLPNGIPQYYVLSAVNAGGESLNSMEISASAVSPNTPSPITSRRGLPPLPILPPKAPPPVAPAAPKEEVPTLESIAMPSAEKVQGIDFDRLLDLRRVEQLRAIFDDTAQKFEEWEVLMLIADEGQETRKTMELMLRVKQQGNSEAFTTGAVALFEKILKVRAQHGSFVRKLRETIRGLEVPPPSSEILEIAIGFILQAPRGRARAAQWTEDPEESRRAAGEYMRMAYTIAQKYRAAL